MRLRHFVRKLWVMGWKRNDLQFSVGGDALIFAALLLLIFPLKWLIAAIMAALWHEFCHYLAVKLCGGRIDMIRVAKNGTVMRSQIHNAGYELICVLAGPLGSLALILLARWIPRIAFCAAVHGIYNLMPIYPLDGGRAFHIFAESILPHNIARRVCACLEWIVRIGICAAGVLLTLRFKEGYLPIIFAVMFFIKTKSEKDLANRGGRRYNSPTIVLR